ncbi:hypothetical protein HH1059_14940 [Halorhodospira halochloris]|uniref:Uncharacterized protein n=1 Tax=Halorhodospira halochloris TaxID=1052 RepID=A0A0X8X9X2_HALHR|nr:hypothetical protein [Halorhodospira halochloris]BAU58200.1 hypothetical protein HH1059_14940 [Halorhodospira halochloris]
MEKSNSGLGAIIAAYVFSILLPPLGLLLAGYLYIGKKQLKHAFIVTTICIIMALPWQWAVFSIYESL